ncbi:MAG: VPLPA-CTERM sorting domain-containing protein [Pseudomonadota bacterium]
MTNLKAILASSSIALAGITGHANATILTDAEVTVEGVIQETSDSDRLSASGPSVIVSDNMTEIENFEEFLNVSERNPVPISIDFGADFISFDFDNTADFNIFGPAFFNGYSFSFTGAIGILLTSVSIDQSVTTLGLDDSDLALDGNTLTVNVEGLTFDTDTFARLILTSEFEEDDMVGEIPLPAAAPLFLAGLAGLGLGFSRRNRRSAD